MNRKHFICALAAVGAAPLRGAADDPPSASDRFKQEWITALLANMDSQLDEATRIKLMESCGRACARRGALASLRKAANGDLDALIKALAGHLGAENVRREGETIHLRYTKCYCELVGSGPARLSDTYCNCSRGWALEVFEAVAGKPVKVDLLNSIRRGGASCDFRIRIGA